jgi:hypothetical protein
MLSWLFKPPDLGECPRRQGCRRDTIRRSSRVVGGEMVLAPEIERRE